MCDESSSQTETVHLEGWLGSGAGAVLMAQQTPVTPTLTEMACLMDGKSRTEDGLGTSTQEETCGH